MAATTTPRVIVGLSGGVDSSVTALLLKEQGYAVEGLFMKNWEEDDSADYCAASEDIADAEAVCERLGIPFHTVNFATEYWEQVFTYFLQEYQTGRTPNPDILCNREIKFKAFLEYALKLGANFIATGHYAQNHLDNNGNHLLLKAVDSSKDQTYFLYTLGQEQLKYSLFPLGQLPKAKVRQIAAGAGLVTHAKKDSTGICFIGERKFKTFLAQYLPAQPGVMETPAGEAVGRHDGLMYYTIGQRQGLGIGGRARQNSGEAWYVVGKDIARNVLIVAQGYNHPLLYADRLICAQASWVSGVAPRFPLQCAAKIRYRQQEMACSVVAIAGGRYQVEFMQPQRAITPGQSIVFYQQEQCLGGAIIE